MENSANIPLELQPNMGDVMRPAVLRPRFFGLFLLVGIIAGCANQIPPLNFSAPNVGVSQTRINAEVRSLTVSIGRPDEQVGAVDVSMIESSGTSVGTGASISSTWKTALEEALNRMVIFRDDAEKKISLVVTILKLDVPAAGLSFTTEAVARYELIDRDNGDIIFTSDIASSGKVESGYAFLGAVRARESANRAVQNNIISFLQQLETVDIDKPMFPAGRRSREGTSSADGPPIT